MLEIGLFFLSLACGFLGILYPFQIVRLFGHLPWAERTFGPAGSYTFWRLFGIFLVILSFVILRYGASLGL